jgi:hypothetical protein
MPGTATAQSDEYRIHTEKMSNGVQVTQHAKGSLFPKFGGARLDWSKPELPGGAPDMVRSIRILMPLDNRRAALTVKAAPADSGEISAVIDETQLVMTYSAPRSTSLPNPFVFTDNGARPVTSDNVPATWTQSIPLVKRIATNASYVLTTLYVVPRSVNAPEREDKVRLVFTVNEAFVRDSRVVIGALLADHVALEGNSVDFWKWRRQPIHTGSPSIASLASWPHGRAAFLEQRLRPLAGSTESPTRQKRCFEDFLMRLLSSPGWLIDRLFTDHSLCSLDPHPNFSPEVRLPLVEVVPVPDEVVLTDTSVLEAASFDTDAQADHPFDVAMGMLFCNDNHDPAGEDCTGTDIEAAQALGTLSPQQIRALIDQMAGIGGSHQGEPAPLATGNHRLDRWLNADWLRAANALNAALAVVNVSDTADEPTQPVKKKGKKKKLVKATCVMKAEDEPASSDPWQKCVKKAKHKADVTESAVAPPPRIQAGGSYHQPGSPEFRQLAKRFANSGKTMPWGIRPTEFERFTTAIAADIAPTGDNLGLVFLNNPTFGHGNTERFRYGLNHIWASGAGGGDNQGHREDWQSLEGLSVNSPEMLAQLLMAALTDVHADFVQHRSRNGNIVRDFRRFTFRHRTGIFTVTNIHIVLAQNGMIITAYPRKNAKASPLNM